MTNLLFFLISNFVKIRCVAWEMKHSDEESRLCRYVLILSTFVPVLHNVKVLPTETIFRSDIFFSHREVYWFFLCDVMESGTNVPKSRKNLLPPFFRIVIIIVIIIMRASSITVTQRLTELCSEKRTAWERRTDIHSVASETNGHCFFSLPSWCELYTKKA